MPQSPNRPLREFRRTRTLNQAQMAALIGVNQATWSKYERGLLKPPRSLQYRIAAILGASVDEAFPADTPAEVTTV